MDTNNEQSAISLELLAITSPGEFVERFLKDEVKDVDASGQESLTATLEELTHGYPAPDSHTVDGLTVTCKVNEGGGEGEGESVYRVYAVIKDGVEIAHFSTTGYYGSDYGTEWDDTFTTVYPRQVTVTKYFTSKE